VTRIEWLTYEHFAPLVGQDFVVAVDAESAVVMPLSEAAVSAQPGGRGPEGQERAQFSLVFHGPAEPVLRQGTYVVSHEALGDQEMFLVPLGPGADAMRYEAAFA
jgi:hypothetical protein